jgi:hypothetical protein
MNYLDYNSFYHQDLYNDLINKQTPQDSYLINLDFFHNDLKDIYPSYDKSMLFTIDGYLILEFGSDSFWDASDFLCVIEVFSKSLKSKARYYNFINNAKKIKSELGRSQYFKIINYYTNKYTKSKK